MVSEFNDKTNFPHKLLLTDTKVSRICKTFANSSSAYIKFSKIQLSKMVELGGVILDIPIFGSILSSVAKKEQIVLLLYGHTLIYTNRYVTFLRYGINKTPDISRNFRKILLICIIKAAFCNSVYLCLSTNSLQFFL